MTLTRYLQQTEAEKQPVLLAQLMVADSAIRNWFLRHAFNVDGNSLTDDEFAQLKEAFDAADDPAIDVIVIAVFGAPSVQIDGTPML